MKKAPTLSNVGARPVHFYGKRLVSPGNAEAIGKGSGVGFIPVFIANEQIVSPYLRPNIAAASYPHGLILPVPVKAKFVNVTAHIKKAKRIALFRCHRLGLLPAIPRIPNIIADLRSCYLIQRITGTGEIAAGMVVRKPVAPINIPRRQFPFLTRRQAETFGGGQGCRIIANVAIVVAGIADWLPFTVYIDTSPIGFAYCVIVLG